MGFGSGVGCSLNMQEALCSILSNTEKKGDGFSSGTNGHSNLAILNKE